MDKNIVEAAKKAICLEGLARQAVNEYAESKSMDAGDVLTMIVDSMKKNCEFNFFGCTDLQGEHVAFPLEAIAEAIGVEGLPRCEEICQHGCCAYINRVLHGVGTEIYESDEA